MKLIPVVVAIGLLTGCAGNKESIGTGAGAVIGAVIGNKVGGRDGAIIGAIIGGAIGNRIGAHLDEEDKKKLAALEQKALATGQGGTFVTNKSKAVVTVEASKPTIEKPRDYGLSGSVKAQPLVLIDPITIRAYVDTPIFNSTNESEKPLMVVQQGVPIQISAKVANENWAVVGDQRVGLGYVPRRYLEAGIVSEAKPQLADVKPPVTVAKADTKKPIAVAKGKPDPKKVATGSTSTASAPSSTTVALSKEQYEKKMAELNAAYVPRNSGNTGPIRQVPSQPGDSSARVILAQASSECKVITRKVAPPGAEAFSEDVKYCNEPPKGWLAQAVT